AKVSVFHRYRLTQGLKGGSGNAGLTARLELAGWMRQTEVLAQGRAAVLVAEHAALAQQRHHLVDEDLDAGGEDVRHDVETVCRAGQEPVFEAVGDLLRSADQQAVPDQD